MTPIQAGNIKLAEIAVLRTPNWAAPEARKGSLVQMFYNVNMGKAHRGMKLLASEYDIDLTKLVPGQYVGFMNRARNAVKLFTSGNMFAYLRLEDPTDQITEDVMNQIPKMFQSTASILIPEGVQAALEAPVPPTGSALDARDHPWAGRKKRR